MKQSEAINILNKLMVVAQKFRSNAREELIRAGHDENVVEMVLCDSYPYLFDEKKSLMIPLEKMLAKSILEPIDLYNMMVIVHRFQPELTFFAHVFGYEIDTFPEPNAMWIANGWEVE